MGQSAAQLLDLLRAIEPERPLRIMNVCGGHERTISMSGLREVMPRGIELIAGPGCPVCVCPEEDIYAAIQLARRSDVILAAFGDMLRVPCNAPKKEPRSLEEAKAEGGHVVPVASPSEVIALACDHADKQVVFFAAGFETTMAPVAAMIASISLAAVDAHPRVNASAGARMSAAGGRPCLASGSDDSRAQAAEGGSALNNLSVLLSGRLTWPAVAMLLESGEAGFDALVAPGHVSTIMGPEEWQFVPVRHGIPTAIAGFTPESLLAAFLSLARQVREERPELENCYRQVVRPGGNATARALLRQTMRVTDATWRGIGTIPQSGFQLAPDYAHLDARQRFAIDADATRKRVGEMPPGCDCARVVLGRIRANECKLYGSACAPRHPVGPCMVSDEGACRIAWAAGVRPAIPVA